MLSQGQLAALAGVSQKTQIAWEAGTRNPTPENLHRVAQALDLDPADLLPIPPEDWTLVDLRVIAGYDQATAAELIGISDQRLRSIETGVNELDTGVRAQMVLVFRQKPGVVNACWRRSRDQLLSETPPTTPNSPGGST